VLKSFRSVMMNSADAARTEMMSQEEFAIRKPDRSATNGDGGIDQEGRGG
jgi:hypothetical protein